jgi:hypothetical protein
MARMSALGALLLALVPQDLANAGFEAAWVQGEPPPGWTSSHGAGREGGSPSRVDCAQGAAVEGRSALKLSGDASVGSWQFVAQTLDASPGERWTLRVAVKSDDVRREGQQFGNSYVRMSYLDAGGERLSSAITPMITGTHDWGDLVLEAVVPERAASAEIALFLSMSGALWIDDLRLTASPTAPFDEKDVRAAAFDALAGHLLRTYPFFDHAGKPKPGPLFKKHRAKAIGARDVAGFAAELKKMLDELDDLHVRMRVEGEAVSTGPRGNPHPTNWNFDAVAEHFAETLSVGDTHVVARLKEGLGYVRLTSLGAEWDELKRADAAMDRLDDARGWILDVRPNGGGGEDKGQFFAARFVAESTEYARHVFRDAFAPDDFTAFGPKGSRWLEPREGRAADTRPVVVLMGPFCVSSTEGLLLMMDAIPTATLVGKPSRGASANPATYVVVPGLEVVASRWRSLTLEGACIEGVGVQPDVLVDERPSKYLKADPTFERAVALLE